MWPKESTTPSRARMRLPVTSSSIRSSSLGIRVPFVELGTSSRSSCPDLSRASMSCCVGAEKTGMAPELGLARFPRLSGAASRVNPTCGDKPGHDVEGVFSQDKAHRAERAQLVSVDQHAALLDAEAVGGLSQNVPIAADIFAD